MCSKTTCEFNRKKKKKEYKTTLGSGGPATQAELLQLTSAEVGFKAEL